MPISLFLYESCLSGGEKRVLKKLFDLKLNLEKDGLQVLPKVSPRNG